jgi:hypothetical protein
MKRPSHNPYRTAGAASVDVPYTVRVTPIQVSKEIAPGVYQLGVCHGGLDGRLHRGGVRLHRGGVEACRVCTVIRKVRRAIELYRVRRNDSDCGHCEVPLDWE